MSPLDPLEGHVHLTDSSIRDQLFLHGDVGRWDRQPFGDLVEALVEFDELQRDLENATLSSQQVGRL